MRQLLHNSALARIGCLCQHQAFLGAPVIEVCQRHRSGPTVREGSRLHAKTPF
jgi:hypothetical protein